MKRSDTVLALVKRAAIPVAIALLACACASATEPVTDQGALVQGGAVIEVQYVNYAWVPTYRGFTIDATGNVFSWDRAGKTWEPADVEHPTVDELNAKYAQKTAIRTMGAGDVATYFSLATQASNGTISAPTHRCADAGEWTISAYLPENGKLKRVLIREEGDEVEQNTSDGAKDLAARIDKLVLFPRSSCTE